VAAFDGGQGAWSPTTCSNESCGWRQKGWVGRGRIGEEKGGTSGAHRGGAQQWRRLWCPTVGAAPVATGGVGEVLQCRGAEKEVWLGRIKNKSDRWWCSSRKGIGGGVSVGSRRWGDDLGGWWGRQIALGDGGDGSSMLGCGGAAQKRRVVKKAGRGGLGN
jgi:hypothetical protein